MEMQDELEVVVLRSATYLSGLAGQKDGLRGRLILDSAGIGLRPKGWSKERRYVPWTACAGVTVDDLDLARREIGAVLPLGVSGGSVKGAKGQALMTVTCRNGTSAYYLVDRIGAFLLRAKVYPLLHSVGVPLLGPSESSDHPPPAPLGIGATWRTGRPRQDELEPGETVLALARCAPPGTAVRGDGQRMNMVVTDRRLLALKTNRWTGHSKGQVLGATPLQDVTSVEIHTGAIPNFEIVVRLANGVVTGMESDVFRRRRLRNLAEAVS
jgi:hypothetical protein